MNQLQPIDRVHLYTILLIRFILTCVLPITLGVLAFNGFGISFFVPLSLPVLPQFVINVTGFLCVTVILFSVAKALTGDLEKRLVRATSKPTGPSADSTHLYDALTAVINSTSDEKVRRQLKLLRDINMDIEVEWKRYRQSITQHFTSEITLEYFLDPVDKLIERVQARSRYIILLFETFNNDKFIKRQQKLLEYSLHTSAEMLEAVQKDYIAALTSTLDCTSVALARLIELEFEVLSQLSSANNTDVDWTTIDTIKVLIESIQFYARGVDLNEEGVRSNVV